MTKSSTVIENFPHISDRFWNLFWRRGCVVNFKFCILLGEWPGADLIGFSGPPDYYEGGCGQSSESASGSRYGCYNEIYPPFFWEANGVLRAIDKWPRPRFVAFGFNEKNVSASFACITLQSMMNAQNLIQSAEVLCQTKKARLTWKYFRSARENFLSQTYYFSHLSQDQTSHHTRYQ